MPTSQPSLRPPHGLRASQIQNPTRWTSLSAWSLKTPDAAIAFATDLSVIEASVDELYEALL